MKIITYKVYDFDELSEKAKENAVSKNYDINVNYDWYDFIYADANDIGLKIEGFDIGRGSYCKMKYIDDFETVINKIKKNHGKKTNTFKTAISYLKEYKKARKDEDKQETVKYDFLIAISEKYLTMLKDDYEYLTSEEAIIETIKANEYTFTEEGIMDNG